MVLAWIVIGTSATAEGSYEINWFVGGQDREAFCKRRRRRGGGESFQSYVNRVVISLKSDEKSGESWRRPGEESSRGQKGFREDVDDGGAMQQRRQHRQQEGEHRLHRRQQQQLQLVPVHDGRETR